MLFLIVHLEIFFISKTAVGLKNTNNISHRLLKGEIEQSCQHI